MSKMSVKEESTKDLYRVNVHLGDMTIEDAATYAQIVCDLCGVTGFLVEEPEYDPQNPKGLCVTPRGVI